MELDASRHQLLRDMVHHVEAQLRETYQFPPQFTDPHTPNLPDMLRDPTVSSGLEIITTAILAQEWTLTPGASDTSGAIAREMEKNLRDVDIESACENALEALGRGFFPHEIQWRHQNGKFWLDDLADINPDQIAFHVDDQMRILSLVSRPIYRPDETIPRGKIWLHQHRASRRYPAGRSILEPAYDPWYRKQQLVKWWSLGLQRYGMPLVICQAPETFGQTDVQNVINAIYNLRLDGVAVLPDSIAYQVIQPTYGQGISFHEAILYMDSQIRRAILLAASETSTNGRDPSVTGQALQIEKQHSDNGASRWSHELCVSLTRQVIAPLVAANHGSDPGLCPRFTLPIPVNVTASLQKWGMPDGTMASLSEPARPDSPTGRARLSASAGRS